MKTKEQKKQFYRVVSILIFIAIILVIGTILFINKEPKVPPIDESYIKEEKIDPLILVNYQSPLPTDYPFQLTIYQQFAISRVVLESLTQMMEAAKQGGVNLFINNTYRSVEEQQQIYQEKIEQYKKEGYSEQKTIENINREVAIPGYSEHHTGLAIDFSGGGYTQNKKMWDWLKENAHYYGFIERYPKNKEKITKVTYEPWHYRYVGKTDSVKITSRNLTLEEYLQNQK